MKIYRNLVVEVINAVKEIFNENRHADKVIEGVLRKNPKWGSHDRRFIAESTYDIVRWWRLLSEASGVEFQISGVEEKKIWIVFGHWCVMKEFQIPPWEEFNEIKKDEVLKNLNELRNIRKIRESVPDWMDDLGIKELGEEVWEKELTSLNMEAKVVIRVNALKASKNEVKKRLENQGIVTFEIENSGFSPLYYSEDALILNKRQNLFHLDEFREGLFEIQDASSQAVAPFLKVMPGMRVVDACAGGGGKTLHLSALMKNRGKIIAMDTSQWKLNELKKRARRGGASNIETKWIESKKTIKRLNNSADRLLLDVPCSGLGVLKRNPDAKWKLSADFFEKIKTAQLEILENYSGIVKQGGILVYATCSIFPSENEKQVEKFIEFQKGKFEKIDEKKILPSMGFDGFYMAAMKRVLG